MTGRSQRPPWLGEDARGWDHARIHRAVLTDDRLGAYELAVYLGLAVHAELATGDARPSIATLAGYANMSVRRAADAVKTLTDSGWITITERKGSASTYRLLSPPTPAPRADLADLTPARGAGGVGTTCMTSPAPGADEQEPVDENQGTRENTVALFETPPVVNPICEGLTATQRHVLSFQRFYAVYPRKVGPGDARKAWPAAVKAAGGDPEVIIRGAARYAAETKGTPATYLKTPGPWLRSERWKDAPGANVRADRPKGASAPITRQNHTPGRIRL